MKKIQKVKETIARIQMTVTKAIYENKHTIATNNTDKKKDNQDASNN